jgi:hypothetical protein
MHACIHEANYPTIHSSQLSSAFHPTLLYRRRSYTKWKAKENLVPDARREVPFVISSTEQNLTCFRAADMPCQKQGIFNMDVSKKKNF